MNIQIVGPGCPRCETTEKNLFNACAGPDLAADIEHAPDVRQFAGLGIWTTPAMVVDGKVVISERVPTVREHKQVLRG